LLDRLSFILGEAMTALRRNGFMTFAAISTVAVSLFLLGGAGYVYVRAVEYANTMPGKFDMRIILKEGTTRQTIEQTAKQIRTIPGVATVAWLPRDAVWELKKKEDPALTEGLDNPLPDAFKVTIRDLQDGPEIAETIAKMPPVEANDGVQYLKEEQQFVDQGIRTLRWLGTGIGGLLLFTAGVLIFNAIRLAVMSRRLEIRIMRLVGASPVTVYLPFIIEGCLQGLTGGLIAAVLLLLANRQFGLFIRTLNNEASMPVFPIGAMLLMLAAMGGMYGIFCSALSLRARKDAR
jgi:cell division transport system permease protein